jgi:hypothetical protein
MKTTCFRLASLLAIPAVLLLFSALSADTYADPAKSTINLISPAFPAEGSIPAKFSCEGADVSPPLAWSGVPAGTKSLVLICDDPDAPGGIFVHWVLFNLPPGTTSLGEKMATGPSLPNGARQGTNGFGKTGYGGPCPPPGKPHHYFFKLYALDVATLPVKAGATKREVDQAMARHILADGLLMGKFQRGK